MRTPVRSAFRAGVAAAVPLVVGVAPFGLVAGAAPVAHGFDPWSAIGLSTIVFAGASQLAIVDALAQGGSVLVAVLAAWTINLRMVLYSASLAPYLGEESTPRRLGAAYLLVDQVYAMCVTRWAADGGDTETRLPFYLGVGALLSTTWVSFTVAGALVGPAIPDDIPLDFAIPLVFLVLLIPILVDRPSIAAAVAGGAAAVAAAEAGAGPASTIVGAAAGIAAGTLLDARRQEPASP
jgi:predicted branched-subunit amino acid permease